MSIEKNLNSIKSELPASVTLVAISKTHAPEIVMQAYDNGHRLFGENRVQELVSKYEVLPKDIQWHLVGHLQRNKVKYIAPFISLIQSVDSLRLLKEIDKNARKNDRIIDCLLQIYIADEDTKYGLSNEEAIEVLESDAFAEMKNVRVIGLMGMATFTDNTEQVRLEFRKLKKLFVQVKQKYFTDCSYFNTLSMGMSGDYEIAIDEGATLVRIGSNIFGGRPYCAK
ncbi:MAG: YggS family pyridoxal phosphate-dependent enzyme [Bacteroidales bacterium]|nr:YggS family pyridoxal phosphate-dependent enzyme [Bacteroidales bacterium]MDD4672545.1 YggS family pyridoxal phosphate-dependent enzyme [Bacteroidales bacterium]